MSPDNAENERARLKSDTTFLKRVVFGLLGVLAMTVGGWAWTVVNATVLLVPPVVQRPYEVGANHGNREYLSDMADYVLQMVLTASPESIEHNASVILKMTDPDGNPELKGLLDQAALRMKRDRVTTVWSPRTAEVFVREKRVEVAGKLKTYVADTVTSVTDRKYVVEFIITSAGRLYVSKVAEVVKPGSRTADVQPG